jgi:hypothetical protein
VCIDEIDAWDDPEIKSAIPTLLGAMPDWCVVVSTRNEEAARNLSTFLKATEVRGGFITVRGAKSAKEYSDVIANTLSITGQSFTSGVLHDVDASQRLLDEFNASVEVQIGSYVASHSQALIKHPNIASLIQKAASLGDGVTAIYGTLVNRSNQQV